MADGTKLKQYIYSENINGVKELIENGTAYYYDNPLHICLLKKNLEIFRLLIQNNIGCIDHCVIFGCIDDINFAQCMMENGCDVHVFEDIRWESKDVYPVIKYLHDCGLDITQINYRFFEAQIFYGSYETIKLLIDIGEDINKNDSYLLQSAILYHKIDIIILLLDNGSAINLNNAEVFDALCKLNNMNILQKMVDCGLNLFEYGEGLLSAYISFSYFSMADYLIELGVKIVKIDIKVDEPEILNYLINHGINVFANDQLLFHCIEQKYTNTVIYFLENGSYDEHINLIIKKFADILKMIKYLTDEKKSDYDYILNCAIIIGSLDVVEYISELININKINYIFKTAIENEKLDIAEYAISNGANINVIDDYVLLKNGPIIQLLIDNDYVITNDNGFIFINIQDLETMVKMVNYGYDYASFLKEAIDKNMENKKLDFDIVEYLIRLNNHYGSYALKKYIEYFNDDYNSKWYKNGFRFLQFLVKIGVEINNDILQIIPKVKDDKIIDFLVKIGIDVCADEKIFLAAIDKYNTTAITALINHGANAHINNDYIWYVFHNSKNYNGDFIFYLRNHDFDIRSNNDCALFHGLKFNNFCEIFSLLRSGLPIRIYDDIILRTYVKKLRKHFFNEYNYQTVIDLHFLLSYYDKIEFINIVMSSECKDHYVKFIKHQYNTKSKISAKIEELNFGIV